MAEEGKATATVEGGGGDFFLFLALNAKYEQVVGVYSERRRDRDA